MHKKNKYCYTMHVSEENAVDGECWMYAYDPNGFPDLDALQLEFDALESTPDGMEWVDMEAAEALHVRAEAAFMSRKFVIPCYIVDAHPVYNPETGDLDFD